MELDRVRRLERAYGALCACNSALIRAISEQQLLDALCTLLVTQGGYRMAWVGYAEGPPDHEVAVRAVAGANDGYLDEARVTWAEDALGSGPTGLAIRRGKLQLNRDSGAEQGYAPWRERALRHGFASSVAVPLQLAGITFGALSVYSVVVDAFDGEERGLLARFAEDLANAIGHMRARRALEVKDEQLRRAARLEVVARLTSGVVHDFRNLLMVVQTCGGELQALLPPEGAARALALDIVEASTRATELTGRLLKLSRAGAATARVQPLGPIVKGLVPLLRRVLGAEIELELQLEPAPAEVDIDLGHLEQVLLNLAVNARDAMRGGGCLRIVLSSAPAIPPEARPVGRALSKGVELSVSDTGTGMAPAVVARIFEPFFTTKPEGEGTGLGLVVVADIVEHHGGRIAVESAVGVGTTFRLFFPAADPPTPA